MQYKVKILASLPLELTVTVDAEHETMANDIAREAVEAAFVTTGSKLRLRPVHGLKGNPNIHINDVASCVDSETIITDDITAEGENDNGL